jgi:PAS domain S-box-containing protein
MAEKTSKSTAKSKKTKAVAKPPDKPRNRKENPNQPAEPKLTVGGMGASASQEMEKGILERTRDLDAANRQLVQARDMFYTLFHSNPIPTLLVRREDAKFINVNEAFLDAFDLKAEEVLDRLPGELNFTASSITLEQQDDLQRRLRQDGNIPSTELLVRHPATGDMMSLLASFQEVSIDNTDAILVAFVDITKRVQAEAEIRNLTANLSSAEQHERHRISQILHDDLQQRLFAIKAQLSLINKNSNMADVKQLEEQLGDAISVTRNLSADISPAILHGEGLADALSWLAEQMQERYGLEVEVNTNNDPARMDENLRVTLFRIARELLFNIYKHSGQSRATITLEPREDGWLRITVTDIGKGFDAEAFMKDPKRASGLLNMRHRLHLLGGRMEVISKPGEGSLVHLDVQVKPQEV